MDTRVAVINWPRLLLGGLVAGLVLLAVQIIFHLIIVGPQWWFFRASADPIGNAAGLGRYIGIHVASGVAILWLYGLVYRVYGKGVRTTFVVAGAYWVIAEAIPAASFKPILQEQFRLDLVDPLWWAVNGAAVLSFLLAAFAGAWLYIRTEGTG